MSGEIIKPDYPELNVETLAKVYGGMQDAVVKQADIERQKKELVDLIMDDVVKTTEKLLEVSELALKHITSEELSTRKDYGSHPLLSYTVVSLSKGMIGISQYYRFIEEVNKERLGHLSLKIMPFAWRKSVRVRLDGRPPKDFFEWHAHAYAYNADNYNKCLFETYHLMPEILANALQEIHVDQQRAQNRINDSLALLEEKLR